MLIVGAGAAGKEALGIFLSNKKNEEVCFFDENKSSPNLLYNKYKVIKSIEQAKEHIKNKDNRFITAIGHPRIREKMTNKFENIGGKLISLISLRANLLFDRFNNLDNGIIIQPGVTISHNVQISKGCMLHANSVIGHSVKIGKYVSVATNASIIGPAVIGDYCVIGANSVVLPHFKIGNNVIVGAGSVVNRDLQDYETFLSPRNV
jgi:sugar O-acyltransferase (sialic acid O-acetyltransferase NeuD family)